MGRWPRRVTLVGTEGRKDVVDGHGAQISHQPALHVGDHQAPFRSLPKERFEPGVGEAGWRVVGLQFQPGDREQAVGAGLAPVPGRTTQAGKRGSQR